MIALWPHTLCLKLALPLQISLVCLVRVWVKCTNDTKHLQKLMRLSIPSKHQRCIMHQALLMLQLNAQSQVRQGWLGSIADYAPNRYVAPS